MQVEIKPTCLKGSVVVPPSKSYSHRGIIASALSCGKSKVSNVIFSNDIKATIGGMSALGANIQIDGNSLNIIGSPVLRKNDIINCEESGSTVRFLIPIALCNEAEVTFVGKNNLVYRPLKPYLDICDEQGLKYTKFENELPIKFEGKLKSGTYNIPGDISSQFITGLLYALPLLDGDSVINITTPLESKGYIDLTLDILDKYQIKIVNDNYQKFYITGNQNYQPFDYYVEGDYSQAAFYLVAGIIGEGLTLKGMNEKSFQGDMAIIDFIRKMGGRVEFVGDDLVCYKSKTHGAIIDLSQAPDLGPIITVLAALSEGETRIINASRLRIKESDRILSITTELRKLGANIEMLEDGMIINGIENFGSSDKLSSWNDHRIAMSLAVASIRCNDTIKIDGMESINKSYPDFIKDFNSLGGQIKC